MTGTPPDSERLPAADQRPGQLQNTNLVDEGLKKVGSGDPDECGRVPAEPTAQESAALADLGRAVNKCLGNEGHAPIELTTSLIGFDGQVITEPPTWSLPGDPDARTCVITVVDRCRLHGARSNHGVSQIGGRLSRSTCHAG